MKTIRSAPSAPTVTQALIVINVLVFFAETATGTSVGGASGLSPGTLFVKGALFGPFISQSHEYYRLVTAGFLHDGVLHILFNMVFLYFMGRMLEPAIGRLNFAVVYAVSLLAGSFGALLFQPLGLTIGASGACFGVLGALIVVAHYRGLSIWQSGLGMTLLINIVFSLSVPRISIGGHLGGVVGGAICGWLIVNLGERRNLRGAALAGCALVGAISVALAIVVASGHGLAPNGIGFGS